MLCFVIFQLSIESTATPRWITVLRQKDFKPSKSAVQCSKHFREEDFDHSSLSFVCLQPNAEPSMFTAFPPNLQQQHQERSKPPAERSGIVLSTSASLWTGSSSTADVAAPAVPLLPTMSSTLPATVLDYTAADSDTTDIAFYVVT